jgi:tol-pal system protein YbgF
VEQSAEAMTPAVEFPESPRLQISQTGERSDKLEYERLLALFCDGDLDGVRRGFAAFLRDYQSSDLSPNARYWLGESQDGMKDYQQAIDSYDRVELDFPQSEKVPAATLKKGYAYLAMKDKKRASSAFKQVVTLYQRSPEAGKASDKLFQLKESR